MDFSGEKSIRFWGVSMRRVWRCLIVVTLYHSARQIPKMKSMRRVWRCLVVVTVIHFLQWAPQIAKGQGIPAVGTDATLDVATWNIEWFGHASNGPDNDVRQIANVRAVIEQADIDLWGVQEIADPDDFNALLDSLGEGYDGILAAQSGTQRIGFLYKTAVFSNVVIRHILTSFAEGPNNPFAGRPPLQLEANVTLDGQTFSNRITFIVLHMKCCSDRTSYERRVEAARRLKNNLDILRANDPIMILGDFNDELTGSIRAGQPSPYDNFLQDAGGYFFPSLAVENAGLGSFCGNNATCSTGSTIDHILVTDELVPFYETGSAARFDALLSNIGGYVSTTSDHLPVFARFRFGTDTAVETEAVPQAVVMERAYPNPFRTGTTVSFRLSKAGAVAVTVFDVLGRRIRTLADGFLSVGTHRVSFDARDLPPGVYLIRLSTRNFVETQPVLLF